MALLTLAWFGAALLDELALFPELVGRDALWFDLSAWFTIIFAAPLCVAIATVLVRAGLRRRGFASRGARLRFHMLAAGIGALSLVIVIWGRESVSKDLLINASIVVTSTWLLLFPMLYWPRLAFGALAGLERGPAPPATPASPR